MKLSRKWILAAALPFLFQYGCDTRSVDTTSAGGSGGEGSLAVDRVIVSLSDNQIFYSQSTLNSVVDTVTVRALSAGNAAVTDVGVSVELSSGFGSLTPITDSDQDLSANTTNASGIAKYIFRLLPDDVISGDQSVRFTASSQGRTGNKVLSLVEQSEILIDFISPNEGSTIFRTRPGATMPVQVQAYREVPEDGGGTVRTPVEGVGLRFSVTGVNGAQGGSITAGTFTTDNSGFVSGVLYSNSHDQETDQVTVRFTATMASSGVSFSNNVTLNNTFGNRLTRVRPTGSANPNVRASYLCGDSTRFVFRYQDSNDSLITDAVFSIGIEGVGETDVTTAQTNEAGEFEFAYRACDVEAAGNSAVLQLGNIQIPDEVYDVALNILDPHPIGLSLQSPSDQFPLEIDSECLEDNVVPIRVLMKYTDTNEPIVGETVYFSASHGNIGGSAETNASGIAEVNWHDCDEDNAGETLEISYNFRMPDGTTLTSGNTQIPLVLPLGVPDRIVVSVANDTLPALNTTTTVATAQVFNSQNQALGAGLNIGFRTNGVGTITTTAITNADGIANGQFAMNGTNGLSQVAAYYVRPNTSPADTLWSSPTTLTVLSGQPANITLSTTEQRIQIQGNGSSSDALITARVVDAGGSLVNLPYTVQFVISQAPDGVYMNSPGNEEQYFWAEPLIATTSNGRAQVTVNAGPTPGPITITASVPQEEIPGATQDLSTLESLVTVVAGPPTYGEIGFDGNGEAIGGGMWRVTWSVHLFDRFGNDVEDSTAVLFSPFPPDVCSFEGFGRTGFDADGEPDVHGVAENYMLYHGLSIGDTLTHVRARAGGLVPEIVGEDTTWVTGYVDVIYPDPPGLFQLPFQPGELDDNLTMQIPFQEINFPMDDGTGLPCDNNPYPFEAFTMSATLVDGYRTPVSDQQIVFQVDPPGSFFDAETFEELGPVAVSVTDNSGVAPIILRVDASRLENTGITCVTNEDCFSYNTQILSVVCARLPDNNPTSQLYTINLNRPCN